MLLDVELRGKLADIKDEHEAVDLALKRFYSMFNADGTKLLCTEEEAVATMVAILDAFMRDAVKLLAYYDADKPQWFSHALSLLSEDLLSKEIGLWVQYDKTEKKLVGEWIGALCAQTPATALGLSS